MRIFEKLCLYNLTRRPAKSLLCLFSVFFLTFVTLGAQILSSSLGSGFESLNQRLGADLIVVPAKAEEKEDFEQIVLLGYTGYFYMPDTVLDLIRQCEGVKRASPQLFLASLSASCCSAKVQLFGYDPESDFSIRPWMRESFEGELGEMEVVVGSDIVNGEGDFLEFYSVPCRIRAKLVPTGTSYDRCVFASEDTVRVLLESSLGKNLNQFRDIDPEHVLSCVLVDAEPGTDVGALAEKIENEGEEISAIPASSLLLGVSDSLEGVSSLIWLIALCVSILSFFILMISVFVLWQDRRREFASLRMQGVSLALLMKSAAKEQVLLTLLGAASGCASALLCLLPFFGAFKEAFSLPMLLPGLKETALMVLYSLLLALLALLVSALFMILRIGRLDVASELRKEA